MKIKGSYCLFLLLSVWFSQALALDLSYQNDIPADNRPSEEYLKKRLNLGSSGYGSWDMKELAKGNTLAEKREKELKEYNDRFGVKNLSFPHDWYPQGSYFHMQQQTFNREMQRFRMESERFQRAN
ncbi:MULTISPECIES: hypothetical protein [Xenorhabdus]|uniref:hypothetical protein n=1 Tax=Xenorhabdus TaxID=626 RepID=UPI000699607B|nr:MULTISPECIES: hypothetical protein [Xenorhabdus]